MITIKRYFIEKCFKVDLLIEKLFYVHRNVPNLINAKFKRRQLV